MHDVSRTRASPSLNILSSGGDNSHNATVNIRDVLTERGDPVRNDGPDQSRALVIPVTLGGIRGAITARFIDFRSSFHRSIYGD